MTAVRMQEREEACVLIVDDGKANAYSPEGAQDAGFLDRVVPAESVLAAALEEAFRLGELDAGAYASTERRAHGAVLGRIRESLQADLGETGALAT